MKKVLAACMFMAVSSLAAHAADPQKHAEVKPKYGGIVKEVDEIQYELVAKPDRVTLYLEDHGRKLDSKGTTAKVTLRAGSERSEVSLAPAGDNRLEATGSFKVAPGTVAIAQVKRGDKPEQTVRFTLK